MLGGVLHWFTTRFRGDDENAADETEDSGFTPSVLDASVRYAHGMSKSGAEREMANVEEKANILEEQRRDER